MNPQAVRCTSTKWTGSSTRPHGTDGRFDAPPWEKHADCSMYVHETFHGGPSNRPPIHPAAQLSAMQGDQSHGNASDLGGHLPDAGTMRIPLLPVIFRLGEQGVHVLIYRLNGHETRLPMAATSREFGISANTSNNVGSSFAYQLLLRNKTLGKIISCIPSKVSRAGNACLRASDHTNLHRTILVFRVSLRTEHTTQVPGRSAMAPTLCLDGGSQSEHPHRPGQPAAKI